MFNRLRLTVEPWKIEDQEATFIKLQFSLEIDGQIYRSTKILKDDDFESRFDGAVNMARDEVKRAIREERNNPKMPVLV